MPCTGAQTYYEILGIGCNAKEEEIKTAYKQAALRLHPDKNRDDSNATAKFQDVSCRLGRNTVFMLVDTFITVTKSP